MGWLKLNEPKPVIDGVIGHPYLLVYTDVDEGDLMERVAPVLSDHRYHVIAVGEVRATADSQVEGEVLYTLSIMIQKRGMSGEEEVDADER